MADGHGGEALLARQRHDVVAGHVVNGGIFPEGLCLLYGPVVVRKGHEATRSLGLSSRPYSSKCPEEGVFSEVVRL